MTELTSGEVVVRHVYVSERDQLVKMRCVGEVTLHICKNSK